MCVILCSILSYQFHINHSSCLVPLKQYSRLCPLGTWAAEPQLAGPGCAVQPLFLLFNRIIIITFLQSLQNFTFQVRFMTNTHTQTLTNTLCKNVYLFAFCLFCLSGVVYDLSVLCFVGVGLFSLNPCPLQHNIQIPIRILNKSNITKHSDSAVSKNRTSHLRVKCWKTSWCIYYCWAPPENHLLYPKR